VLARPEGYVRVFADEGAPMAALLGKLVAARRSGRGADDRIPREYVDRLRRAFERTSSCAGPSTAMHAGLVEPLSRRELEVLHLLVVGKRNQEIADELVVALNTVKKHIHHIFDKLGASNRTEATARARELGLLP
jgi:LuxR family transcriptional regulator, maltose regulon positive regulatory protein